MHFEHIAALPELRAIQQVTQTAVQWHIRLLDLLQSCIHELSGGGAKGLASGIVKIAASMSATKLREIKQYVADSTMPSELLGGADGYDMQLSNYFLPLTFTAGWLRYAALYPTANEIWQNDIDAVDLDFVGELLSLFKVHAAEYTKARRHVSVNSGCAGMCTSVANRVWTRNG